ncbi:MAG: replicative DNA helicase [Oscillospiraceae bacterium]|nr:replicative DNA helicase [Oscillospiraceae bacterium]
MDVRDEACSARQFEPEMGVIGSLLISPEPVAGIIFHKLRPEDFGVKEYRAVFCAARDLWLDKRTLDPMIIANAVGDQEIKKVMANAMQLTPTAANVESYVELVIEQAQLRKLRDVGMRLSLHLETLDDARKLLAEAEGLLSAQREERVWSYKDLLEDYLEWLNDSTPPDYLNWGIPQLNQMVQIAQGCFVVIGAASSTGKTALGLQLAYNIARTGKRVGFFSYETPKRPAAIRIFANTAGVDMVKAKNKDVNQIDYEVLMREGDISMTLPFKLEDQGDWTVDDLRARTLAERYEVIFLDYVQMVPGDPRRPRWEVVTETSMKLHRMAQKLGVTVIALSQVTEPERDSKGKRRSLTKEDLRESKQLANDAEAVLMMELTRAGDYDSERELRVVKNKDGSLGKFWLKFEPHFMRFTPCEKPEHLKRQEYRESMAALSQNRKQSGRSNAQRDPEYRQAQFEEIDDDDDEIPF